MTRSHSVYVKCDQNYAKKRQRILSEKTQLNEGTYDHCGRIKTVSNGTSTIEYLYDGLGQLMKTNDPTDTRAGANGSVWVNTYDAGGNIATKKLYTYDSDNDNLLDNTLIHTYSYTYDATWKDKLVSFDGRTCVLSIASRDHQEIPVLIIFCHNRRFHILSTCLPLGLPHQSMFHAVAFTIENQKMAMVNQALDGNAVTSDAMGNTTGYNGWTYTWEAGRQLKQMSSGATMLQFKYNDSGLRTQKINGATTTWYYWAGSVSWTDWKAHLTRQLSIQKASFAGA